MGACAALKRIGLPAAVCRRDLACCEGGGGRGLVGLAAAAASARRVVAKTASPGQHDLGYVDLEQTTLPHFDRHPARGVTHGLGTYHYPCLRAGQGFIGVPEGTRTPDLRFRKPPLYPAELPGRTPKSWLFLLRRVSLGKPLPAAGDGFRRLQRCGPTGRHEPALL